MIVIGLDVVERYFAARSGHKGTKAARSQFEAWRAIAETSNWRTPADVKGSHPKASILKGGRVVFNIKANHYRLGRTCGLYRRCRHAAVFRLTQRVRSDRCGDGVKEAKLIVIQNEQDHAAAKDLIERLMSSESPVDHARLKAQAQLVEAYEEARWPRRTPPLPELLIYLMDQHGLTRADLVPLLGTASRVSEVLNGKRNLSMSMVRKLRDRFRVSADLLIPATKGRSLAA
jgi:HTH-type transcriptional regulator/antitoxin HigA